MLEQMLTELLALPAATWDAYAFYHEPLKGKLQGETGQALLAKAKTCGQTLAQQARQAYPTQSCREILLALGAELICEEQPNDGSYTMFACFTEPNTVTLYQKNLTDAAEALAAHHCGQLLGDTALSEVLLGHELFHWYEYHQPALFTNQKVLPLWKLFGYTYTSKVTALGEAAAMAFTQALLALPYSPYLLDVVLLYQSNPQMALAICNNMLSLAGHTPLSPV